MMVRLLEVRDFHKILSVTEKAGPEKMLYPPVNFVLYILLTQMPQLVSYQLQKAHIQKNFMKL